MFKGHCFPKAIILQAVYFKLRFSLSYRDVEELLSIRGVKVDHATIQRWVFKFTPLVEQQFRKRKKLVGKRMNTFESKFKLPIGGKIETKSKYENYLSLKKGKTYSISEKTPLMPEFEASLKSIENIISLTPKSQIKIYSIRKKSNTIWYEVNAKNMENGKMNKGWINSIALIRQEIRNIN